MSRMKNVLFAVLFLCGAFVVQPGLAHGFTVSPQRHDNKDGILPWMPLFNFSRVR